jgi:hypothetical protein
MIAKRLRASHEVREFAKFSRSFLRITQKGTLERRLADIIVGIVDPAPTRRQTLL